MEEGRRDIPRDSRDRRRKGVFTLRFKGGRNEGVGEIYLEIQRVEEGRGDIPRDPRVGGRTVRRFP